MDGEDTRTTLDRLNAELAILDRPLEDDVEYYDDPPPRRLWHRIGATLGAFTLLGAVAAFAVTRWSLPAAATEASARAAVAAPPPAASPAPMLPAPAPVAGATDDTVADQEPDLAPAADEASATGAHHDWSALQPVSSRHKSGHDAPASHHHHHHHHHHAGR